MYTQRKQEPNTSQHPSGTIHTQAAQNEKKGIEINKISLKKETLKFKSTHFSNHTQMTHTTKRLNTIDYMYINKNRL